MPFASASHALQPDNTERLLSRRQSAEGPFPDAENQHRFRSKSASAPHTVSERQWAQKHPDEKSLWPKNDDGELAGFNSRALKEAIHTYFLRWKGEGEQHPPPPPWYRTMLAWIGAYISLLLISGMQHWFGLPHSIPMLLSTFGPTCALVFGLPTLPASQPMNGIVGSLIGGVVGLFFRVVVGQRVWVAMPLGVATAIALQECISMQLPSGIATTLLLTTLVPESSFQATASNGAASTWCIRPMLEQDMMLRFTDGSRILLASVIGQLLILFIALVVNNLHPTIGYPKRWL